jgi:hypothetical protein
MKEQSVVTIHGIGHGAATCSRIAEHQDRHTALKRAPSA